MLRFVIINRKKVPVPVPIKNLRDLVGWIDSHLVRKDHSITRLKLDQQDIDLLDLARLPNLPLSEHSLVECQIDSPLEIGVQTLDALRNLCMVLERSLKPLAVHCWQLASQDSPSDLRSIFQDLDLIDQLLDHLLLIIDVRVDAANAKSYRESLQKAGLALKYAADANDWQAVARVLLRQVEATIIELGQELGSMQKCVFELIADHSYCPSEAFLGNISK